MPTNKVNIDHIVLLGLTSATLDVLILKKSTFFIEDICTQLYILSLIIIDGSYASL